MSVGNEIVRIRFIVFTVIFALLTSRGSGSVIEYWGIQSCCRNGVSVRSVFGGVNGGQSMICPTIVEGDKTYRKAFTLHSTLHH